MIGNWMAALSFVLWGLLPLYYQHLPAAAPDELLAVRLIASVPVAWLIVALFGKLSALKTLLQDKRSLWYAFLGSSLMSISWVAFTWAMTHERVIDASLGFFISPLTMNALGIFVLKETISAGKKLALFLAFIGLSYQVYQYGQVPYVALVMAIFFTLYGWCKKKIQYTWSVSLFVEATTLAPLAIMYLLFKHVSVGAVSLNSGWETLALYAGAAPMTLGPLVFYSIALRLTTMSTVGLMQYIEPSIQFLLAVWFFGEIFDSVKAVSFAFIWVGLLLTISETLIRRARNRRMARLI
nr:EamA family transporter RarD [Vibrio proteolyticus]